MKNYKEKGFDKAQILEIRQGLEEGVDVSMYDKLEFNADQMYQISD